MKTKSLTSSFKDIYSKITDIHTIKDSEFKLGFEKKKIHN